MKLTSEVVEYITACYDGLRIFQSSLSKLTNDKTAILSKSNSETLRIGKCPEVKLNIFSENLKLDFGDGCGGPDGKTYAGSIKTKLDFSKLLSQSIRIKVEFDHFSVDHITINAVANLYVKPRKIEVEIDSGRITVDSGDIYLSCDLTIRHDTKKLLDFGDDEFELTGSGTIIDAGGNEIDFEIIEPLVYDINCGNIRKGILHIFWRGLEAEVDFYPEEGQCDSLIRFTIAGFSSIIDLETFL